MSRRICKILAFTSLFVLVLAMQSVFADTQVGYYTGRDVLRIGRIVENGITIDINVFYLDPVYKHEAENDDDMDYYYVESDGIVYDISEEDFSEEPPVFTSSDPMRQKIIDKAMNYRLNKKTTYVYTGKPHNYAGRYKPSENGVIGFNCMSFAEDLIEPFMRELVPGFDMQPDCPSLQAADYIYNKGYKNSFKPKKLSASQLQPGDIILFDNDLDGKHVCDHVGIYLGNDMYAHCNNYGTRLKDKETKYSTDTRVRKDGGVMVSTLDYSSEKVCGYLCVIPTDPQPANEYRRLISGVTMRKSPATGSTKVASIPKNTTITILYSDRLGNWKYVKYGSKYGFISTKESNLYAKIMKNCTITASSSRTYTGKALKPTPTVKYKSSKLTKGTHYTVSYGKNISIGKGTIKITGKGSYKGSCTISFKINPPKPTLKSASCSKAGSVKATWTTVKGSVSGYEVSVDGGTPKQFKGSSSKSGTVSDLSAGSHSVKVRAYKYVSGTKYVSGWTTSKSVTVK